MSYEFITDYNAASYTSGRNGNKFDKIVIHHWGATGQTFEGVCSWFENPACSTSAHAVVEEGRVACLVAYDDTAYHAGVWETNLTSIGIECRPEMSDGDLETLCQYIADLWKLYGVMPLYGHKDFYATACPGLYYDKLGWIYDRAMWYYNGCVDDPSTDAPEADVNEPSAWAKADLERAIAAGITTGERPRDYATREEVAIMLLRAMGK